VTEAGIGFGANLGDPADSFARALAAFAAGGLRVLARSSLWRSAPWGITDQPDFLNAVALVAVREGPEELLACLKGIEVDVGRRPGVRWGPRVLDLDLLWHGDLLRVGEAVAVPHPRLPERSFVLEPAAEVAPGWRHPELGLTLRELRDTLRRDPARTACERIEGSRLGRPLMAVACRP
jgi:2-amino-4-hydroxy-6-hydroxymethyldihydropteridine diphosphokinase